LTVVEGLELTDAPLGADALPEDDWREATIARRKLPEPTGHPVVTPNDPDMRVLLAVPMERTIGQLPFFGFIQIFNQGWPLARLEYTRNDIARCQFAEFLLKGNYTHLLMLDSDHVHPPDVVQRIARWFRAYPDEVRVCGGLNFRRGAPFDPCAFVDPDGKGYRRMAQWYDPTAEGDFPGAIEVDALGSGSLMIAKTVLEEMVAKGLAGVPGKPFFGYNYQKDGWPGTDMWFSELCHAAGITLWCDTTTVSPHVGDRLIDEATYRAWLREHGVDIAPAPAEGPAGARLPGSAV
jgi:hypothetical protein